MRVNLPGYYSETLPSGTVRHVVRKEGDKRKKTSIPVGPENPDFLDHYNAARRGEKFLVTPKTTIPKSLAWLMDEFEDWMEKRVASGLLHPSTLHQRRQFYARLRPRYAAKHMQMPTEVIARIRDEMMDTPGAADNMVKALRAMYSWACHPERRILRENPAVGLEKLNRRRDKGATPWTVEDLQAYRERHPRGTMAHLALSLFMFTACRISDAVILGRGHETRIQGVHHLSWVPSKKGSSKVTVPLLPPLQSAIAAQRVIGPTYLLTAHGRPFSSSNGFDNWFRKRVIEAGLCKDVDGVLKATRSSHGIRKAAGHLLALEGASQYHIMAVHGHSDAKTSQIYTESVDRQRLASQAMDLLAGMEW